MGSVTSAIPPGQRPRLAGIEGLRALAACAVAVFHGWLITRADTPVLGVHLITLVMEWFMLGPALFFVLSGFLLYRPWARATLTGSPPPSVRRYARRRLLRIVPGYWVILLLASFLLESTVIRVSPTGVVTGPLTDPTMLLANLFLVQGSSVGLSNTGIAPAWSLAVEAGFYIALPLVALLAARLAAGRWRARRRRAGMAAPLILLAAGMCGKLVAGLLVPGPYVFTGSDTHFLVQSSFFAHADEFALGMLVAILRVDWERGRLRLPGRRARIQVELAALVAVVAVVRFLPALLTEVWWLTAAALAAMVLAAVVLPPVGGRFRAGWLAGLEAPAMVWTGTVSYSLFLWSVPVAWFLALHGWTFGGVAGLVPNITLVLGVSLGLSALTYRFVELPAMRWDGRTPPLPAWLAARGRRRPVMAGAAEPLEHPAGAGPVEP